MANDNIFSGLKVVDLASFIAGPRRRRDPVRLRRRRHQGGAAGRRPLETLGTRSRPSHKPKDAYPWHLANRNKRGMTLDLKVAERSAGAREARQMGRRVHRQYAASRAQEIEARI